MADPKAVPWLFEWRDALLSERGPKAMQRFVLMVLATHGDLAGADIYPSTRLLAEETGLSRRAVENHLRAAVEDGWIVRSERAKQGQGWRRMQYALTIPSTRNVGNHVPHLPPGSDNGRPDDDVGNLEQNVGNLEQNVGNLATERGEPRSPDLSMNTPQTSPSNTPLAELRVQRADRSDERPARQEKMNEIIRFIELHDAVRLATKTGLIPRDAQWVIEGVGHAQEAGMVDGAGGMDAYDLAAEALYDLQRKHKMFSREMFVSWVEQAIKVRALDDSDVIDDCELAREAWPVKLRSQRR